MTPFLRFLVQNRHGNARLLAQQEREMTKKLQKVAKTRIVVKEIIDSQELQNKLPLNYAKFGFGGKLRYQLGPVA